MHIKKLLSVLTFAGSITATAQSFTYEGAIGPVDKSGLYRIALSPQLRKYMSSDLHDLRICDSAGHEVPFVQVSEPLLKEQRDFIPYEIVSQSHLKNHSTIIIQNQSRDRISNISFNIANSDAFKYCAVDGSNDQLQWYSVSALQELSLAYSNNYTSTYKCIYFPLSDYRYYRLTVEDWHSQPLKINAAGYFRNSKIAGKLNSLDAKPAIKEVPEQKLTRVQLTFDNSQEINRIDFRISAPRLFKRHVTVYADRTRREKHSDVTEKQELFSFELSSDKPLWVDVPALREKEIWLEIENKDNPPLAIDSIQCRQLAGYLVCDLSAGNRYTLKCGNRALHIPEYDLANFVSATPQLLPEAPVAALKAIPPPAEKKSAEASFLASKGFLWLCLGLGGLVVLLFSLSLLKDMGKKPVE